MERDFKGIWIPKEIWLNKDLTMNEKLFLIEIDSLDNENGCFASNDYFADFFGLSKNRCSEIIKSLEKKGLLFITYKYRTGTKSIEKRIIKVIEISTGGIREIKKGGREIDRGYSENSERYSENTEDNNTPINNTITNNTPIYISLTFIDDVIDKVKITQEQYDKLCSKHNKDFVHKEIIGLDNYITNGKGAKYKDHYKTLNTWLNSKKKEQELKFPTHKPIEEDFNY